MDGKKLFEKYYSRLAFEGLIKALLLSLAIAFATTAVVALILWLTGVKVLIISICVLAGLTVAGTPILYYTVFKPDTKAIARRLDKLGLEERMITMTELDGEDSLMANLQREDAKVNLATVDKKSIPFLVPTKILVALASAAVAGIAMTTVGHLSDLGIIGGGDEWFEDPPMEEQLFEVSYMVEGGGFIEGGDPDQLILFGESAETVVAVAEEGWTFDGWDDGNSRPSRTDVNIVEDVVFTAIFVQVEEGGGMPGGEGEGEGEGEGTPADMPGEGNGDSDSESDNYNNAGGGKYEEKNQIIDGETYYRDVYDQYYEEVMRELEENGEIPEDLKDIIEAYFGIIK